jgi:hypothetical protein
MKSKRGRAVSSHLRFASECYADGNIDEAQKNFLKDLILSGNNERELLQAFDRGMSGDYHVLKGELTVYY